MNLVRPPHACVIKNLRNCLPPRVFSRLCNSICDYRLCQVTENTVWCTKPPTCTALLLLRSSSARTARSPTTNKPRAAQPQRLPCDLSSSCGESGSFVKRSFSRACDTPRLCSTMDTPTFRMRSLLLWSWSLWLEEVCIDCCTSDFTGFGLLGMLSTSLLTLLMGTNDHLLSCHGYQNHPFLVYSGSITFTANP